MAQWNLDYLTLDYQNAQLSERSIIRTLNYQNAQLSECELRRLAIVHVQFKRVVDHINYLLVYSQYAVLGLLMRTVEPEIVALE